MILLVDFIKNIHAIKDGSDPLWTWKMKDLGYVITFVFAGATTLLLTKAGISKLKDRASKSLALRNN